jgi:hypothetical protein
MKILKNKEFEKLKGYSGFLDWVNSPNAEPFKNSLYASIVHKDYFCYCVELFEPTENGANNNLNNYLGFLVVDDERLLIFLNGDVFAFNYNKTEVATLFIVADNPLEKFYSNQILLKSSYPAYPSYPSKRKNLSVSIYRYIFYGTERFNVEVKEGSTILAVGTIQGFTVNDSIVSSYSIKIDKLEIEYIPCFAALKQLSKFKVIISSELSIEYTTNQVGQEVKVPKSESSVKRIKELVRKKIIFADI